MPHTSGILADRYLLPQPSGNSVKMQAEEVLVPQIRPEARWGCCQPGPPAYHSPPPPEGRTDSPLGRRSAPHNTASIIRLNPDPDRAGILQRTFPPLLPQEARPGGGNLEGGFPEGFPLGNTLSHLPPPPPPRVTIPVTIIQSYDLLGNF